MAKKSKIVANEKRKAMVVRYQQRRDALRTASKDATSSIEERRSAMQALAKLPRKRAERSVSAAW